MTDIRVTGAEDFLRFSKAMKTAGRTDLRKQLNKGLRDATKPLIKETKAATSRLPQSGGLAALVKAAPQKVQTRTGRDPGVRIVAGKKGSGARGADVGAVRHPVFGNRNAFAVTQVEPGWFSQTLADSAPTVRPLLLDAMQALADQIVREAR